MSRIRPYPEGSVAWDEAFRQRERADNLETACRAVLDALEKLAADGEIIWLDPPHVMSGVHESAIERLKSVIDPYSDNDRGLKSFSESMANYQAENLRQ
jgi:hypothetical protein